MIKYVLEKIGTGGLVNRDEAIELAKEDVQDLCRAAGNVRKTRCGDGFELCTIINGKSGRCTEDCKYCAQSSHFCTPAREYGVLPPEEIVKSAASNHRSGVQRFSIVTSGKRLSDRELEQVCEGYRAVAKACPISLCASHGLLNFEQMKQLRNAGVTRYHNNLETSRRFFPSICTTHTYDEKIETIKAAQKAGLEVCSGGIIGLGETMEDRIDMALTLRELEVDSVPLNVLNPIPGTPLEHQPRLSYEEVVRTAALFRLLLPHTQIRLAGGRALFPDKGERAICAGVNAVISGDMLTTSGITTAEDIEMVHRLGFAVRNGSASETNRLEPAVSC